MDLITCIAKKYGESDKIERLVLPSLEPFVNHLQRELSHLQDTADLSLILDMIITFLNGEETKLLTEEPDSEIIIPPSCQSISTSSATCSPEAKWIRATSQSRVRPLLRKVLGSTGVRC